MGRPGPRSPVSVPGPSSTPFPVVNAIAPGIDYRELANAQSEDQDVQDYRTAITNLKLADVPFSDGEFSVLCDTSTGVARPIVPETWKRRIFDTIHTLSHPGIKLTKRLVSAKFVWHGLGKQITHWARTCLSCQRAKVQTHVKAPIQQFQPAARRFDHVHIDLVGPLPESQGFKYLLTVVDRFTRWPEALPIKDIETRTIARVYAQHWIARFGVPTLMTSDRGPQFVSDLWSALSSLLGTSLHPTTAYHPQANGLVERMHRTLKGSLKARLTSPHWIEELPWVMLGLRTNPREDLKTSPAEMVYGAPLTVPGDFVPDGPQVPVQDHLRQLREKVGNLKPVPTIAHGTAKTNVPDRLLNAKYVFIRTDARRTPLQTPFTGPYAVIERNDKFFTIQMGNKQDTVSIDRLKEAHVEDDGLPVPVAQPPRRGRPPLQTPSPNDQPLPAAARPGPGSPVSVPGPSLDPFPPLPIPARPSSPTPPMPSSPTPAPTPSVSGPTPTYAEVSTRGGRRIRLPARYQT